jgi:hypothetical protein
VKKQGEGKSAAHSPEGILGAALCHPAFRFRFSVEEFCQGEPMKILFFSLCVSVISSAALVSFDAFAASENDNFADRKAKMVSKIEERIQKMEEMKTCVSAATDKAALMACHKAGKEWRKGQSEERKEMRKARREKRKAQEEKED